MSIATELQNYSTYLTNAYNKAEDKGATIPQNKNLQNLTDCIDTITGTIIIPPEYRNTNRNFISKFTYKNNLY